MKYVIIAALLTLVGCAEVCKHIPTTPLVQTLPGLCPTPTPTPAPVMVVK